MDIFTRQAWAYPLKTKGGKEIADIFETFFNLHPTERLQSDEGKEFYNQHVKRVLDNYGIELFSIFSPTKAAHVERLNRTIKGILERYFTAHNTKNWVDVIDQVMENYNNRQHSSIGMTPNEVHSREKEAFENMYNFKPGQERPPRKLKFAPGMRVRISKKRAYSHEAMRRIGPVKNFSSLAFNT